MLQEYALVAEQKHVEQEKGAEIQVSDVVEGFKRTFAEEENLRIIQDTQNFVSKYESHVKIKKSRPTKLLREEGKTC